MNHKCGKCGKPVLYLLEGGLGKCCYVAKEDEIRNVISRGCIEKWKLDKRRKVKRWKKAKGRWHENGGASDIQSRN